MTGGASRSGVLPRDLRVLIEDAVERLITLLDALDGDADGEDGGDTEPSLGAPEGYERQVGWMRGSDSDREVA